MKSIFILLFTLSTTIMFAQDHNKILLVNGYLHAGNGDIMESALIGIEAGKISLIQNALAYTYNKEEWDTIIELHGQHIYPGFIAPNSTLGLTEIDAVRATRDYREVGTFNPHIRSQIVFNVESNVISTVRTNGVLIAQPTPRGGRISGTSSIMKMDGWNWEDATITANDGIHINWPNSIQGASRWSTTDPKKSEKYEEQKEELYSFFDMAIAYSKKSESTDNRLEAMRECFKGEKRVFFHADELQQLLDIIEFSQHYKLAFPVIVGGYDSHLITRQLKDAKIPVMLQRTHSLPEHEADDVDLPYKLPFLLKEGGVKFCLQNHGDMEAMNARNLPFLAGTARAYGLSDEDAVSALSLWTSEILGIDNMYGSIEKGKSATLFVSSGDALDMRTNQLSVALIDGKFMSLSNSQKELFEKYQKKYETEK